MAVKVYISGICGSQEVRKQQQRVLFILQTMPIDLQVIDVTEPGQEDARIFMQEEVKKHDKKILLPPQIFNENEYCGDYADFQLANDDDEVMRFLKLEDGVSKVETVNNAETITQNGVSEHENNKDIQEETKNISEDDNDTKGEAENVSEDQNIVVGHDSISESEVEKLATHDDDTGQGNQVPSDDKDASSEEEESE